MPRGAACHRHDGRDAPRPRSCRWAPATPDQGSSGAPITRRSPPTRVVSDGRERGVMSLRTPYVACLRAAACWTALGVGLALGGCTTAAPPGPGLGAEPRPDPPPVSRTTYRSRFAKAYYNFTVAQLEAQQGRMKEAVKEMREALREDPRTAMLWAQMTE